MRRARVGLWIVGKAFGRLWGRDVMLYTGGVSFFALLAVFPAVALLIGFYKIILSTGQATQQAAALADVVPAAARSLFDAEVQRLTTASTGAVSVQSAVALIIGGYAAHRGFKALLAGLTFIHDEDEPMGFLKFNVLAFVVALAAFALFTVVSGAIVTFRLLDVSRAIGEPLMAAGVDLEWFWAGLGLMFGLSCLYRYAMSHSGPVIWRAAIGGGVTAAVLSLVASWACAFYVDQIAVMGATYGSVGAVVVFLIWLSWNVNAIFLGGALATEVEIALEEYRARRAPPAALAEPLNRPVVSSR